MRRREAETENKNRRGVVPGLGPEPSGRGFCH